MADETYQPKVYLEQGGNKLVGASGGEFEFYNTAFTADKLENFFLSFQTHRNYFSTAAGYNISVMSINYGFHAWSAATGFGDGGSIVLPTPDSGCILVLIAAHLIGNANVSVGVSDTATTMINTCSVAISGFELSAGGWAQLVCLRAGEWAVVCGNISNETTP